MRIDTRLAERLKKVNPSSTLAITSKAKKLKSEGFDIVNLAAGEPAAADEKTNEEKKVEKGNLVRERQDVTKKPARKFLGGIRSIFKKKSDSL